MDKNRIIEKLSWITQSKLAPQPITQEYKEILKKGEKANDDSQITVGDLTEEGFQFYAYGIRKWHEKYDRAKDKDKAINDFAFIEKKLKEFKEKQQ